MYTEELSYTIDATTFKSYIIAPKKEGKQPTVLVFPAADGRNQWICEQAERIAAMGYVACAVDMYGDAQEAHSLEEYKTWCGPMYADRALLKTRISAAYQAIRGYKLTDPAYIAAMGYCFGGMCALDLARYEPSLRGVVSLHGSLYAPKNHTPQPIQAKILAAWGYDDPQMPSSDLPQFADEMNASEADWQVHFFGHTQHAFCDPNAAKIGGIKVGRVYNPLAAKRSWDLIANFLPECLS